MTDDIAKVRGWLIDLPDRAALLPDALITRPQASGSRPAPGSRPPVNLDVLAVLDRDDRTRRGWDWELGVGWCDPESVGVLPYLWGWARDIEACAYEDRPEMPAELPDPPTVAGVCSWLLTELDWAATLPQWPEMVEGVRITWRRVRDATAHVADPVDRPVPCRLCGFALERVAGDRPLWQCKACGHEVSVQAVTIRQAAKILRRPERTIRTWATRSLIKAISDGPRSNLYDLGDIRRVHAEVELRDRGA